MEEEERSWCAAVRQSKWLPWAALRVIDLRGRGKREGGMEGRREGGKEGVREGWREGRMEGRREGGMNGWERRGRGGGGEGEEERRGKGGGEEGESRGGRRGRKVYNIYFHLIRALSLSSD